MKLGFTYFVLFICVPWNKPLDKYNGTSLKEMEKTSSKGHSVFFTIMVLFSDSIVLGPCTKEVESVKAIYSQSKIPGLSVNQDFTSPSCNDDGTYKSTQCLWFGCHCVTRDGKYINGTDTEWPKKPYLERKCEGNWFPLLNFVTFLDPFI